MPYFGLNYRSNHNNCLQWELDPHCTYSAPIRPLWEVLVRPLARGHGNHYKHHQPCIGNQTIISVRGRRWQVSPLSFFLFVPGRLTVLAFAVLQDVDRPFLHFISPSTLCLVLQPPLYLYLSCSSLEEPFFSTHSLVRLLLNTRLPPIH